MCAISAFQQFVSVLHIPYFNKWFHYHFDFFEGSAVTRGSGTAETGGSRMQLVKCPGIGFTSFYLNVGWHVELTCKDGDLAKPR